MKYCSTYLWEKGRGQAYHPMSLILQQVEVRKQSVLFACVCRCNVEGGADANSGLAVDCGGYFTEALVEWFHRDCLNILERKWSEEDRKKYLEKELVETMAEVEKTLGKKGCGGWLEYVGMLLVEQWFVLFSKGKLYMHLINRRYNRKHIRCIAGGEDALHMETGMLQKRLGILLCAKEFMDGWEKEDVAEVLLADGDLSEARMQKRLRELWRETDSVGAVYFRTY